MKLFKTSAKVIAVIAITITPLSSHSAEVRSMSRPFVNDEDGVKVASVSVTCAEVDQPRVIVKVGKSKQWCAKELTTLCNKQKVAMAKKVCGTHFDNLVSASKTDSEPVKEEIAASEAKPLKTGPLKTEPNDKSKLEAVAQKDASKPAVSMSDNDAKLQYEKEKTLIEQKLQEIKRRQSEIAKRESELREKLN